MRALKPIAVASLALALAGCQSAPTKEDIGTVLGGIGGAVIGAQFGGGSGRIVGTAVGTLAGAFLGREIGRSLDAADKAQVQRATQAAETAPVGQQIVWSNPETGNSGTVTPTREGQDTAGNTCREYKSTVNVGGKTEEAYGTACRQPDGTWKIVN
jgi:surface antigen